MEQHAQIEQVFVVSHTHWDREWYQDFQAYRVRLVYMIDELLDMMEHDEAYRFFMMDGQTIMIDDYLEIRPEQRARLMALIEQRRILVGPWYVMPDEFLVSGESLIRNLLVGFRRAHSWGVEPVKSGYVTDIFGHNSQLPQILRGFGIDNAVLFRGFGDARSAEIWWEGADGSGVLGLKLDDDRCYSNFYFFLRWPFTERDFVYEPTELVERAQAMLDYAAQRTTTGILLGLDGVDHIEVEPQLPWMLHTLNQAQHLGATWVHTHLEAYLDELRKRIGPLTVYRGEQHVPGYRGVNNWVLTNVLSSRVQLKQRNHACESSLEQWAEPWAVFAALQGRPYPYAFLHKAWEWLLQNHPHDSICGCSIDQVHRNMIYRFDQSQLISNQMITEQLEYFSNHLQIDGLDGEYVVTLFNSSQNALDDAVVEVEVALPFGTSFRLFDTARQEVRYQLLELQKGSMQRWRPYRDIPHGELVDRYRIAFRACVPPFGYTTYVVKQFVSQGPGPGEYAAPRVLPPARYPGTMQINADTWDNGCMQVQVCPNGTLIIRDHETGHIYERLLLFEDEADIGEGWNYVRPVTNETFTSLGARAEFSTVWNGPLHTRLCIRLHLPVPRAIESAETRRSMALVELPITTYIDLLRDSPLIRCHTIVENTARDHRLRLLLPSGLSADQFFTSTPFDVVERSVSQPDYSDHLETAQDVVPHNGLVALDDGTCGLALYSKGLYEVAVRDDQPRTIALTLFRSTGKEVLSDGSDGGQLLGKLEFHYAIRPFANTANHTLLWNERQQWSGGLRSIQRKCEPPRYATPHRRAASLPLAQSFLTISPPDMVVSAIKCAEDRPDRYVVRLLNLTDRHVRSTLQFCRPLTVARLVSLDEQPLADLPVTGHTLTIEATTRQIITLEIVFAVTSDRNTNDELAGNTA